MKAATNRPPPVHSPRHPCLRSASPISLIRSFRATTLRAVATDRTATVLLASALDGDGAAWAELVDRYQRLLWWIARRHRLDEAEAADVVQTVWLALLRHGRAIHDPERLESWLATTCRREAWARLRQLDRQVPSPVVVDAPDVLGPRVDDALLDEELRGDVLVAFSKLDRACQELLRLACAVPPLSKNEIAARMGMPPGSYGPRRARCLEHLRNKLGIVSPAAGSE